jgi:predicted ABC-type ATPase
MSPYFLVIAGPNGAGKTTLTSMLKKMDPTLTVINGDLVYKELRESGLAAGQAHTEAQRLTTEYFFNSLKQGKTFVIESNMSAGFSYDSFSYAKKAGFNTRMYYLGIETPEDCFNRVKARSESRTGHFVPYDDVVKRFNNSILHLKTNAKRVDQVVFFDNSSLQLTPVLYMEQGVIMQLKQDCPLWVKNIFSNQLKIQEKLNLKIESSGNITRGFEM